MLARCYFKLNNSIIECHDGTPPRQGRAIRRSSAAERPTNNTSPPARIALTSEGRTQDIGLARIGQEVSLPAAKSFCARGHPKHGCAPVHDWANEVPLRATEMAATGD
jgi:hypothetical protein